MGKILNYRQTLFVKYYTSDKETKGNCYASMIKAGYKHGYAIKWSGCFIGEIRGIKEAIEAETAKIESQDVNSREFVTREMLAQYNKNKDSRPTEAIRALENLGKNCGWFAEDNAQQVEASQLTEQQRKDQDDYNAWKRRQLLKQA